MINTIQVALERKRLQAREIAVHKEVKDLRGLDWPHFLHYMTLGSIQFAWDQYIACEVFDLING